MRGKVHGAVIRERGRRMREIGARADARGSGRRRSGPIRPGLTLEDGTLVVTGNYLKVRIPAGSSAGTTRRDGAGSRTR